MSAIRPLATIAALMVLGYFLWTRINTPALETMEETELALAGVPPLTLDSGEETGGLDTSAPPFDPSGAASSLGAVASDVSPTAVPQAKANNNRITPLDASQMGAMPDLPPLPNNIPEADYSEEGADSGTISGNVPSLGTEVPPPSEQVTDPMPGEGEVDVLADSGVPLTPEESVAPDATGQQRTESSGVDEEFAAPESAFASARPAIEQALERGELERAHLLLSGWYGDRTLTTDEREEVDALLSQLAGTVVYSPEHRLEAPHRVRPGETLETIAQKYEVPWQLLAKINGVPQPSAVTPGQELKVIRGPFSAVVDVTRQQLALMVADRYAGKFGVKTEGLAASEGEWVVTQKQKPSGEAPRQIILEPAGGPASGPANGTSLVLGPTSDSTPATAGAIRVGPTDQNDLFDILSIGSRVIIRQ